MLSDISDVRNEAAGTFCIDDDPRYRAHCRADDRVTRANRRRRAFANNLVVSNLLWEQVRFRVRSWSGLDKANALHARASGKWTIPAFAGEVRYPRCVEGGIARSLQNMQALADLLAAQNIPLTIVVYPWPMQLAYDDRDSRQVGIWRDFCSKNCWAFIDLFPAFFAQKDAGEDWYENLFIVGDVHWSPAGHELVFRELAKYLLARSEDNVVNSPP